VRQLLVVISSDNPAHDQGAIPEMVIPGTAHAMLIPDIHPPRQE
jgi:hypothetical protein